MSFVIVLAFALSIIYVVYRYLRQASQRAYIGRYPFHPALKQRLKNKRPTLTDAQLDLVFQGLRDYFDICNQALPRRVAMPSQAIDDAWHEFILFTRNYQQFCQRAFGRFLHHVPAETMTSPTQAQDGIKRVWRLACRRENIDPLSPARLPLLFALDAQLGIADGFIYSLQCQPGSNTYCAGDIGCGGGCSGGDGGCSADGGCSGGCGGD